MPYFDIEKAPKTKHLRWNVSCPEGYRHYTVAEMAKDGTQLPGGFTDKDGAIFHKGYYLWAKDLVMAASAPAPEPEKAATAPTGKVAAAKKGD